jgi:hypothetical protein
MTKKEVIYKINNQNAEQTIDDVLNAMFVDDWNINLHIGNLSKKYLKMIRDRISGNDGSPCKGYSLQLCAPDMGILNDIDKNDALVKLTVCAIKNGNSRKILVSPYLISLTILKAWIDPEALIFDVPEINMLTSLTLRYCKLTATFIREISEMKQLHLNYLDISHNLCSDDAINPLIKILQNMPLNHLDITHNIMNKHSVLSMFDKPSTCDTLESFCYQVGNYRKQQTDIADDIDSTDNTDNTDFSRCYNLQSLWILNFQDTTPIICPMSLTKIDIDIAYDPDEIIIEAEYILDYLVGTNVVSCRLSTEINYFNVSFTQFNPVLEELIIGRCSNSVNSYIESMLIALPNLNHVEIKEVVLVIEIDGEDMIVNTIDTDKIESILKEQAPQMKTFVVQTKTTKHVFVENKNKQITLLSLLTAMIDR